VVSGRPFFTDALDVSSFLQANRVIGWREEQVVFAYRYCPLFGAVQLAFRRGRTAFREHSDQGNTFFLRETWMF
jgi:hypothetical protein|tara:strand:+ start:351 stop:572 length:222 start_codon:yes stop_codon:yes gene_type:complete